jgi:hypothetical protein
MKRMASSSRNPRGNKRSRRSAGRSFPSGADRFFMAAQRFIARRGGAAPQRQQVGLALAAAPSSAFEERLLAW